MSWLKLVTAKKETRLRNIRRADEVDKQVKKLLTDVDQKLILMVRG